LATAIDDSFYLLATQLEIWSPFFLSKNGTQIMPIKAIDSISDDHVLWMLVLDDGD
jgi:hypothetical protein